MTTWVAQHGEESIQSSLAEVNFEARDFKVLIESYKIHSFQIAKGQYDFMWYVSLLFSWGCIWSFWGGLVCMRRFGQFRDLVNRISTQRWDINKKIAISFRTSSWSNATVLWCFSRCCLCVYPAVYSMMLWWIHVFFCKLPWPAMATWKKVYIPNSLMYRS